MGDAISLPGLDRPVSGRPDPGAGRQLYRRDGKKLGVGGKGGLVELREGVSTYDASVSSEVYMRTSTTIDWDFLEVEEEEWQEIIIGHAAPECGADRPPGWRRFPNGASIAVLVTVLAVLVGCWVWGEAQRGLALLEGDVRAKVHVETLRHNQEHPSERVAAAVRSVDIKPDALMARVTVTETRGNNDVEVYTVSRFYTVDRSGLRRSPPLLSLWGKETTLDTANLHFTFHELDRQVIEIVAGPLDAYSCALREFLGLPPLAQDGRIAISVVPTLKVRGALAADGAILHPSPLLLRIPAGERNETVLLAQLRSLVLAQTLDEALDRADIKPEWRPVVSDFHWWLAQNFAMLSATEEARRPDGGDMQKTCGTCAAAVFMLENVADYTQGYSGYRSTIAREYADAFFDFLVSDGTQASIPKLLAAFGRHTTWQSLAPEVFGMSFEDLQRELRCGARAGEDDAAAASPRDCREQGGADHVATDPQ